MGRLEEMIGKSLPNCGLKANPHIDSRLKTFLGKFRAILLMLGTSGFKWDDERNMISVEKSVYDEFCKAHSSCRNLYGVPFPHLRLMMEIYGKDYATGKPSEGFEDAIDNFDLKKNVQVNIDLSDDDGETQTTESAPPPPKKVKRENISKKRRSGKVNDQSSSRSELACLQDFMKDMNGHLSTMADVWVRAENREQEMVNQEKEMTDKSIKAQEKLFALDGLSTNQAFEALNVLSADKIKLNIFLGLSTSLKGQYVKTLLGHGDS